MNNLQNIFYNKYHLNLGGLIQSADTSYYIFKLIVDRKKLSRSDGKYFFNHIETTLVIHAVFNLLKSWEFSYEKDKVKNVGDVTFGSYLNYLETHQLHLETKNIALLKYEINKDKKGFVQISDTINELKRFRDKAFHSSKTKLPFIPNFSKKFELLLELSKVLLSKYAKLVLNKEYVIFEPDPKGSIKNYLNILTNLSNG